MFLGLLLKAIGILFTYHFWSNLFYLGRQFSQHNFLKFSRSCILRIYDTNWKIYLYQIIIIKYEEHNVVYQFSCEREPFKQAQFYIGYTTTTFKSRMTAHAQHGFIKKYLIEVHHQSKVATQKIMKNITILRKIPNPNDIQMIKHYW